MYSTAVQTVLKNEMYKIEKYDRIVLHKQYTNK